VLAPFEHVPRADRNVSNDHLDASTSIHRRDSNSADMAPHFAWAQRAHRTINAAGRTNAIDTSPFRGFFGQSAINFKQLQIYWKPFHGE